ncbi:MAG: PhnD/SsuA/transferrin family substrate-binding protein [Spirochaetia bacterium]|nr:PhnD/SsuA/transferrin family substrate-binding protein [Spirochaetia bacterium]
MRDKVIVIGYSAAIPNDTVSFAPSFDAKKRAAIIKALTEIAADKDNLAMLTSVYNWTGLAEAKDAFFDDFRQQLDASGVKVQELMPTKAPTAAGTAAATKAATAAPTAAATK